MQVTLTDAGSHGNAWIVTDGLDPGDQLIVDGLKNLRAGDKVEPTPVTIGDDGVVQPTASAAPTSGAAPAQTPAPAAKSGG